MIADSRYRQMFITLDRQVSCNIGAGEFMKTIEIDHDLPYTPLLIGQWSTDANFEPAYDIVTEFPNFYGGQPEYVINIGAGEDKIYINLTNNSGRNIIFYFRLLAIENPDYSKPSILVSADKTKFRFDSRWNYPKIFKMGKVQPAQSVYHGLGYAPVAKVWSEIHILTQNGVSKKVLIPVANRFNDGQLINGAVTDSSNLIIKGEGKFYYIIFGDRV